MMNKTEQFIRLIENKKIRQAQLCLPYACAILLDNKKFVTDINFETINKAIISRWSMHGLINIKDGAWGILEYLESNRSELTIGTINNLWIRD